MALLLVLQHSVVPLVKHLLSVIKLPVANFESRENNLPTVLQNVSDMDSSKDKKKICLKFVKQLR